MGHSEYDSLVKNRRPWNAARKLGATRGSQIPKTIYPGRPKRRIPGEFPTVAELNATAALGARSSVEVI